MFTLKTLQERMNDRGSESVNGEGLWMFELGNATETELMSDK